MALTNKQEIDSGERFAFGDNWARFLKVLNEERISEATFSLKKMLEINNLYGKTFLDVGSGSGLFSLAARRLGAKVLSFDYDPKSVLCTKELKERYFKGDNDWEVQLGSVLDKKYLEKLGKFDIVYSWGVLHHTGDMWSALGNIDINVAKEGKLFIALYNDQQWVSKYWLYVKYIYNKFFIMKPIFILLYSIFLILPSILFKFISNQKRSRGMNIWVDLIDWLGGIPFEVSKPEKVLEFYERKGYQLKQLKTVGGKHGCNEYIFQRSLN
jgi:2-polyprenyl-6-hydroxyphenyl methylase/3-demethylubiquinone-9 3-methyltransferase